MLHPFSSFCGNCGILPIFEYIRIFEYETERMSNIRIFEKPIFTGHSSRHGLFGSSRRFRALVMQVPIARTRELETKSCSQTASGVSLSPGSSRELCSSRTTGAIQLTKFRPRVCPRVCPPVCPRTPHVKSV